MNIDCCELCSGFHSTSQCEIGFVNIRACVIKPVVDDYRPVVDSSNVVQLITDHTYRAQPTGRRAIPKYGNGTPGSPTNAHPRRGDQGISIARYG